MPRGECFNAVSLTNEVEHVLMVGEIVEFYEDDYPLPSYLLKGQVGVNRSLHVVVGVTERERILIVITVYAPDLALWSNDFTRRKK